MIFQDTNLEWLTCMQSLEVPLQVVNMTWFINNIQEGFEFKFELKLSYIADYTVEVL
jgi:hypothetical protein